LQVLREKVAQVHLENSLKDYIVKLVQATRNHPEVALGASPRGSLGLMKTSKAFAGLEGREFVIPDDVKKLAAPTLAHRLMLKPEAYLRGKKADEIINEVLNQVPLNL